MKAKDKKRGERLKRKTRKTDEQRHEEKVRLFEAARPESLPADPPRAVTIRRLNPDDELRCPGVYWYRGYLRLALSERAGKVQYICCNDGAPRPSIRSNVFLLDHSYAPDISPAALALNLVGRVVIGSFRSSVDVYRRLIDMAQSKEELMKMSERAFAAEYSRIMKLDRPVQRMKPTDETVDKLMEKLKQEDEILNQEATLEGDAAEVAGGSEEPEDVEQPAVTTNEEKGIGMGGTKKASKKLAGAAAEKKKRSAETAKKIVDANGSKDNPYRAGSMKAKCFEIYKKGGERGKIIEAIKKEGAKDSTATSWYGAFTKVPL